MDRDAHGIEIKLEENPRCSLAVLECTSVVRDAVLVRLKRVTTRSDISRRNNM